MTVHVANLVQASAVMLAWTAELSQDYPIVLGAKICISGQKSNFWSSECKKVLAISLLSRDKNAIEREPCKLACRWPSVSILSKIRPEVSSSARNLIKD